METDHIGIFRTISLLFSMGNPWCIIPVALCLVGVLIAAWKAPRWVTGIGLAAFIISLLAIAVWSHYGIRDVETIVIKVGYDDCLSPSQVLAANKHLVIAPICGLLVYIISQVIGLLQSFKR